MKPQISVLMSVYNCQNYLNYSINSILMQKFNNFLFYIIDDGSDDDSKKIIKKFAKKDERIIALFNGKNRGLTHNLNLLLKKVNTKYIARMDADDICHKDRFYHQYRFLENNKDYGFTGTGVAYIDEAGNETGRRKMQTSFFNIKKKIYLLNLFNHGSIMARNDIFKTLNGYRDFFKYSQDYDLWLRALEKYKACNIKESLYYQRKINTAISNEKFNCQAKFAALASALAFERLKKGRDSYEEFYKHGFDYMDNYKFKKYFYLALNVLYYYKNKKNTARSYAVKSIKNGNLHWRNFRSLIDLI